MSAEVVINILAFLAVSVVVHSSLSFFIPIFVLVVVVVVVYLLVDVFFNDFCFSLLHARLLINTHTSTYLLRRSVQHHNLIRKPHISVCMSGFTHKQMVAGDLQ